MTPAERAREIVEARRQRIACATRDPCFYDNTCANHKALAEFEREWAAALAAQAAQTRQLEAVIEANPMMQDNLALLKRLGKAEREAAQTRALREAIKKALRLFSIKPNKAFTITAWASPTEQAEIYDVLRAALTGAPREPQE